MLKHRHFGFSFIFVFFARPISSNVSSIKPPACDSQIYCYGKLLHTIQMAQIYADSKTFVDMAMKNSPTVTLEKFNEMMTTNNDKPTNETLKAFVEENFLPPGVELEDWDPTDWNPEPKFLELIENLEYRKWASKLNEFWKKLGRKMIADVKENSQQYSIIPVDNPVIVPGGRFREFYYWDSYWVIKGLLHCDMYDTVRGMLKNFISIVDRYGFVPNGGRIYYSQRSQPPLLIPMVKEYIDATGDLSFIAETVKILEHEFLFWMNNHTQVVNGHVLAAYGDKSSGPRPESYREDVETANEYETNEDKEECYSELKAAAESGMDFSSRWFISSNGTNDGTLKNLKTRSIIPVDLNAFLYWNAKILADFYDQVENENKSNEYELKAKEIMKAINAVLWNEEIGVWLDYDIINKKSRNYFTPTNLTPLLVQCYNIMEKEKISKQIINYIDSLNLDKYPGGVPNTLKSTGEQWDYPNVWPPMQYLLIMGLDNLDTNDSKNLAEKWAKRWIESNYVAYKNSTHMFEKYNAEIFGGYGGGGEYSIQLGFGWTNGIIIDLLVKYGIKFTPSTAKKFTENNET